MHAHSREDGQYAQELDKWERRGEESRTGLKSKCMSVCIRPLVGETNGTYRHTDLAV